MSDSDGGDNGIPDSDRRQNKINPWRFLQKTERDW
jgi:hypothetical protein